MKKSIEDLKEDLTLAENNLIENMQALIDRGVYGLEVAKDQIEALKNDLE